MTSRERIRTIMDFGVPDRVDRSVAPTVSLANYEYALVLIGEIGAC